LRVANSAPMTGRRLSLDCKWRVLHCVLVLKWSNSKTAEFWEISHATVKRLKQQYNLASTLSRRSSRSRYSRCLMTNRDLAYVKALVEQFPDYFLDEFCACFERDREKKVSKTTMWRAIVSLGFTQHKLDIIAKQASDVKRAEYLLHIVHFDIPQLVFVDEVHTDHRTYERHFGWAMAGRRAVKRGIYLRGEKYSSAAAISTSGVLTHYSLRGGFKALDFQFFMETFVIPVLGVYPAAKSVVVMDNASIHKKNILSNLAAIHGFLCVFLPPYSPVLNPIETMFSKFKYFFASIRTVFREYWYASFSDIAPCVSVHN